MAIEQAIHGSIRFDQKGHVLTPDAPMKIFQRKLKSITNAIDWRVRSKFGDEAIDNRIVRAGLKYRQFLNKATFFGIAGSVGKTTAKELLVGILNVRGRTIGNPISLNKAPEIAKVILRTRPWHKFCVAELGETAPGSLDKQLAILQPLIGIITVVGDDHLAAFGSRQAIALEFAKLVQATPIHGTIALNLDDELVATLSKEAKCRVITYGTCANADLQATEIVSIWPDPLQFTATFKGESVSIRTQLYGKQLLSSALAAIVGGIAAGLSLADCAKGISSVFPTEGRMQPVHGPRGITFIRDDFKAPAWSVRPLLDQLRDARAHRKVFVLGTISDCRDTPTFVLKTAREALAVADIAIFTGRFASAALKARKPGTESRLHAFTRTIDVANFLQSIQQQGDLILLKGTNKKDHLSRIPLSLSQTVNCWVDDCGRDMFCSECSHLRSHRGPPGLITQASTEPASIGPISAGFPTVSPTDPVIIGLGNPGPEFIGTPHNVGYDLLDHLGSSIACEWQEYPEAWIAKGVINDCNLVLIKIKTPMNLTGSVLKRLSAAMRFDAAQCILVFDDIDLPLGKVRTRLNGSAGGHRGVASILEAFQSDAFRRVKMGVGKPGGKLDRVAYVLTPFADEDRATIEQAVMTAEASLRELMPSSNSPQRHKASE
jgi:UDP-N-acetylmuramoyl-tripeptide--D-alanyl-D-alanine ligase